MEQQGLSLAQGLRQTAARHRPLLLGLGVALALALYRQWPWWVALLAALGMAAPFAACALAWRHVLQHRQGLCAALAGDAMGLRESLQALTDAALSRPWAHSSPPGACPPPISSWLSRPRSRGRAGVADRFAPSGL